MGHYNFILINFGYIKVIDEQNCYTAIIIHDIVYTVEPPNKGHFGNGPFVLCSEVVLISHFDLK